MTAASYRLPFVALLIPCIVGRPITPQSYLAWGIMSSQSSAIYFSVNVAMNKVTYMTLKNCRQLKKPSAINTTLTALKD
jgi:hypothetical protein